MLSVTMEFMGTVPKALTRKKKTESEREKGAISHFGSSSLPASAGCSVAAVLVGGLFPRFR